jgi:hypothetical protein
LTLNTPVTFSNGESVTFSSGVYTVKIKNGLSSTMFNKLPEGVGDDHKEQDETDPQGHVAIDPDDKPNDFPEQDL